MKDVAVIIVNFNTKALLQECLVSLPGGMPGLDAEVFVIDNGSTDGSVEMVRESFQEVVVTVNSANEGFARPNNTGMKSSHARYVFLLNSDAALFPGSLTTLVQFMDAHPRAGACGPRLLYPDGRPQRSVKGFPSWRTHIADEFFLDRVFPGSTFFSSGEMLRFNYDRTQQIDHAMAAAFLVRREVLEGVGMFDERFRIYYNDMDWCYRIKKAGWEIWYVGEAAVSHHLGSTVNALNKYFALFEELHENIILFYRKRYGAWAVPLYKILLALGAAPRALGWTCVSLLRATDRTTVMREFSWRSLWYGARFWKPLHIVDVPDEATDVTAGDTQSAGHTCARRAIHHVRSSLSRTMAGSSSKSAWTQSSPRTTGCSKWCWSTTAPRTAQPPGWANTIPP